MIKNKKETIYPLGFLQDSKKSSIFCRTLENPDKLFLIINKKNSPLHFSKTRKSITIVSKASEKKFNPEKIDSIISSKVGRKETITFLYGTAKTKKLYIANYKSPNKYLVEGALSNITERGGLVSSFLHGEKHVLYYGDSSIHIAGSVHLKKWTKEKEPVLKHRPGFFDKGHLKFIASKHTERGILVFYDASIHDGDNMHLQIGAALFSPHDPKKVIWRSDEVLFEKTIPYEPDLKCIGALFFNDTISIYWYSLKEGIISCSIALPFSRPFVIKPFDKIKRGEKNPIIAPESTSWWRSVGTLNPAAVNIDGTVHLLFRAMGHDGISRIGYAKTQDGLHVDEIYPEPVFSLEYSKFGLRPVEKKFDPVMYPSGGSWGGCEDPRMVRIRDRIYLTFNAFDNWDNIRVGIVSISLDDFLNKRWNWSPMKFISPVGRHKNWLLFPEKIYGKYALFHNLHAKDSDRVLVEYFDTLDSLAVKDPHFHSPDPLGMPNRKIAWHLRMKAPGPAPVKTSDGWLVLYQAHDSEFGKYKIGALLLDLDDPTKIIARSLVPILTPETWYENDWKPGIVYACGAVVKDGTLFIYYGGGDKHVCVATVPLATLLESLQNERTAVPVINKVIIS